MAALHAGHVCAFVRVKGAPNQLVKMCDRQREAAGDAPIDAAGWHVRAEALAAGGMQVLAAARRAVPDGAEALSMPDAERDLVLLDLLDRIDPPRKEAVAAGIRVKMIAGDHAATAAAIARQVGLRGADVVLTGRALDRLDDAALRDRVRNTGVLAAPAPNTSCAWSRLRRPEAKLAR